MKARVFALLWLAAAALVILTPWAIFPVCGVGVDALFSTDSAYHACHGTLRAETVLGIVSIVIAFVPLLWPGKKTLLPSSIAFLVISALVIGFPTVITGLCKMPTMACRIGTLPALVILGIMMGVVSAAGLLVSRKMP